LIEVHSTPEQGARFGFDIAAPEVAAPWPEPVPQPAPDRMPASLAGRVLFVEDNEVNRCVIGEMLGLLGLTTVEAGDGREAQRLLHHQPFDLVLMDCEMPLQDGFETAQAWRAHEVATARPRLPILALTANTLPEDLARAIASGMDEVLCKPISFEQLRDALGRWLPAAAG
jgi:CheY-like chemotaxis protein